MKKIKNIHILEILNQIKSEIKKVLNNKFDEIILFGSYARGDYTIYSDIDLVLIVKGALSKSEDNKIMEIMSQFSLKYDIVLTCIDYPKTIFEKYTTPFILNVKTEGIKI